MKPYIPPCCSRRGLMRFVSVALASSICVVGGARSTRAQTTSAVEIVNESIIVNVGLGAGRTARMLLDTGAQTTTFSRAAADRLSLRCSPPQDANSLLSGIGTFDHLDIGAMSLENVPYGVLKLKNDVWEHIHTNRGGVDGSLGLDLLSKLAVGIDMAGSTITLWKSGDLTPDKSRIWFDYLQIVPDIAPGSVQTALKACDLPPGAAVHVSPQGLLDIWLPPQASLIIAGRGYRNVVAQSLIPIAVHMEHRDDSLFLVRGELDGYPFAFDLDTGSNRLTLPPGFARILKPSVEVPGAQLSAVDTTETVTGCIYRNLRMGDFEVRYPYALASAGHSAYTRNPTLGMGPFANCKLLLDFPNRVLSVARAAPDADAPRSRLAELGLFLVETEGKQRLYVGTGSPGDRAGLRSGDGLVRCEGLPPARPDSSIAVRLTDQDQPVVVTVRRYGVTDALTFTFDHSLTGEWASPPPVAIFPSLPTGYIGAKRFPNGGLYHDADGLSKLVKPGGSVLCENGKFQVAYHDTSTKSFSLNLPKDRFQIVPAQHDPGMAPVVARGMGLLWIGGVGWVIGPTGTRIELDGFSVALRPGRGQSIEASVQ